MNSHFTDLLGKFFFPDDGCDLCWKSLEGEPVVFDPAYPEDGDVFPYCNDCAQNIVRINSHADWVNHRNKVNFR